MNADDITTKEIMDVLGRRSSIDESPLRSTSGDFDRFINSRIWYDIQRLIKDRINYLVEQIVEAKTPDEIMSIRSQIKSWKEMLGIPSYLKQCAHIEAGNKKQGELEL